MQSARYPGDNHHYLRGKKGKNYHSYCNEEQRRPDGLYRCIFNKRESILKEEIANGNIHTCQFEKVKDNRIITSYFTPKPVQEEEEGITYNDIMI